MSSEDSSSRRKTETPPIDWGEIRRRLEAARVAIEQAWEPSPEETRKILTARARALGQAPATETVDERIEVLEFILARERYAIESRYVREVCPLEQLTPLPCTPAFVLGIVNLRGEILSVIDIKKFFELPEQGLTDLNKVMVLDSAAGMRFGVLADVIVGVREVPRAAIQPSLPTLTGIRADYLQGVTAERLVILDAGALLTDPDIVVQDEVSGQGS